MLSKTNFKGALNSLIDVINTSKSSGTAEFTLKYSVRNIKALNLNEEAARLDIVNAFNQWSALFNSIYADLHLSFEEGTKDPDIIIQFNPSSGSGIKIIDQTIKIDSTKNWKSILTPSTYTLFTFILYGIGKALGLQNTQDKTPLSTSMLLTNLLTKYSLKVSPQGIIKTLFLRGIPSIKASVVMSYGNTEEELIYGCTDIQDSVNYNPLATQDDGSCIKKTATASILYSPLRYFMGEDFNTQYHITSNSQYSSISGETSFSNPTTILNSSDTATTLSTSELDDTYGIISKVITEADGTVQFFILMDVYGNIEIFNEAGDKVSADHSGLGGTTLPNNPERAFSSLNINIFTQQITLNHWMISVGDKFMLTYTNSDGDSVMLVLNTNGNQYSGDSIVVNCNDSTYKYGNIGVVHKITNFNILTPIDSWGNYDSLVADGEGITAHDTEATAGSGPNSVMIYKDGDEESVWNLAHSSVTDSHTIPNKRTIYIPNIHHSSLADYGFSRIHYRMIKFCLLSNNTLVSGWPLTIQNRCVWNKEKYTDGTNTATTSTIDTTYDFYVGNVGASNTGTKSFYIPIAGFSFATADLGIYSISAKKWNASSGMFNLVGDFTVETLNEIDTNNPSNHLLEYGELPCIAGNVLRENTYYNQNNTPGATQNTSPYIFNDENGDLTPNNGDYLVAFALKHGFLLLKANNLTLTITDPSKGGIEVHVGGGDSALVESSGGWTPIVMVFSPDDNFLYTILENPLDSTERSIGIFNVTQTEGGSIVGNAKVIDNPFSGALARVILDVDGTVKYFSDSGSEYINILSSDLQSSVDMLGYYPNVLTPDITFSYLPSSYNLYPGQEMANFYDLDVGNYNYTTTDINSGPSPLLSLDYPTILKFPRGEYDTVTGVSTTSEAEGNWDISISESSDEVGGLLFYAYIKDGVLNIKKKNGENLYQSTSMGDTYSDVYNRLFSIPLIDNSYMVCYLVSGTIKGVKISYDTETETLSMVSNPIVETLPTDFSNGIGVTRKNAYEYVLTIPKVDEVGDLYVATRLISPGSLKDEDNSSSLEYILIASTGVENSTFTTVINTPRNTSKISIGVSDDSSTSSLIATGDFDVHTGGITNIESFDITPGYEHAGSAKPNWKVKSIEFSSDNSQLYVLLGNSAVVYDNDTSKVLRLSFNKDEARSTLLNTLQYEGPLYTYIYDGATFPDMFSPLTDASLEERIVIESGSKVVSLFTSPNGAIYTLNSNSEGVKASIGYISGANSFTDSRLAKAGHVFNQTSTLGLFQVGFNFEDESLHGGGSAFGTGDDPDPTDIILGCMDNTACNYCEDCNTEDGSCTYSASDCDCNNVTHEGIPYNLVGVYNENCDECYWPIVTPTSPSDPWEEFRSNRMPSYDFYLLQTGTPGNFTNWTNEGLYDDEHCYSCQDPSAFNYEGGSCDLPDCIANNDLCTYAVCDSSAEPTACNGVTPAANEVHDTDSCYFPIEGCECSGETGILSAGYCGDCATGTTFQVGLEDGFCDCTGDPVGQWCTCDGDQLSNTWESHGCGCDGIPPDNILALHGVCDCEGLTTPEGVCDCDGNFNTTTHCDCTTAKTLYYADPDGNEIASCAADTALFCDGDDVSGYVLYVEGDTLCEECGIDPNTGIPSIKNCNNVCRHLPGVETVNPDFYLFEMNVCDQCVTQGSDLEDCCSVTLDYCGACSDYTSSPNAVTFTSGVPYGATSIANGVEYSITTMFGEFTNTQTTSTCSCEGLSNPDNTFQPSSFDSCNVCGGSATHDNDQGFKINNGINYCNCDDLASEVNSISSGSCCPSYFYDNCLNTCVPNTEVMTPTDCNGECNGSAITTDCGCGEPEPVDGCCNGEVPDCAGTCGGSAVLDGCNICGGDGTSCEACMNEGALNFCAECTEDLNTHNEELCTWLTLDDTIDAVVIDTTGTIANTEGVIIPNASSMPLDNIVDIETISFYSDILNADIEIDNEYWTSKCQVISLNNLTLNITNPAANAEITLTGGGVGDISNVQVVNPNVNSSLAFGYTPTYYFRIDDSLAIDINDVTQILTENGNVDHTTQIQSVSELWSGLVNYSDDFSAGELAFETIEKGTFNENGADITTTLVDFYNTYPMLGSAVIMDYPGYKIYSIVPKATGNSYAEFSIDFTQFLTLEAQDALNCVYMDESIVGVRIEVRVEGSYDPSEELNWVMYSATNVIKKIGGVIPESTTGDGVSTFVINLEDLTEAVYFIPIGFTSADVWKRVYARLMWGCTVMNLWEYGANHSYGGLYRPYGTMAFSSNGDAIIINDNYYIDAVKDVEEFTDIFLRIDTSSGVSGDFSDTSFKLIDLSSGEDLLTIIGMEPSASILESIKISDSIRLGVHINNPGGNTLNYKIVTEFGTVILNKKID